MGWQRGWVDCTVCGVFFYAAEGLGVCLGGGQHVAGGVGATFVYGSNGGLGLDNVQLCNKCLALVAVPGAALDPFYCFAGGSHDVPVPPGAVVFNGPAVYLMLLPGGTELGWFQCYQCLAISRDRAQPCPSGGQHLYAGAGPNMTVLMQNVQGEADPDQSNLQFGWRQCVKCQMLYYPAGDMDCIMGERHASDVVTPPPQAWGWGLYITANQDGADVPGTAGYNICDQCSELVYRDPSGKVGACPAGGAHVFDIFSTNYAMLGTNYFEGARKCAQCCEFSLSPDGGGKCPGPTGVHDLAASPTFLLYLA